MTKRPSRELDERVPDGLPVPEVALMKAAKAYQVAYRTRRNHYLHHHRAPSAALAATALPLGYR